MLNILQYYSMFSFGVTCSLWFDEFWLTMSWGRWAPLVLAPLGPLVPALASGEVRGVAPSEQVEPVRAG